MKPLAATLSTLALLVVPAVLAVACAKPSAAAADDWASHLEIEAQAVAGKDGHVRVVLQGKSGWFVNTAYPGIKIGLTAPEGVKLAKTEAGKADVKYEAPHPGGKAERAVFEIPLEAAAPGAPIQGTYKIVMCSPSTCSPPFTGTFTAAFTRGG